MKNNLLPWLHYRLLTAGRLLRRWCFRNSLSFALLGFLIYTVHYKHLHFQLSLNAPPDYYAQPVSFIPDDSSTDEKLTATQKKHLSYIQRYAQLAQQEMKKYGIPASIKLAQGLLESNAGQSPLAEKNNNHFGIKCFSKSCKKGHCRNFSDDHHKDFFRVYANSWESYRAHSQFLAQSARYKKCFQLPQDDYKGWAEALHQAGYATDPKYSKKIVGLIETYDLYRYD